MARPVNIDQIAGVAPQVDGTDKLGVSLYGYGAAAGDTSIVILLAGADGVANTTDGIATVPMPMLFNGTTWDRQRNNEEVTLLASAARTASLTSAAQVNYNARGIALFVRITSITATPSLTPRILMADPVGSGFNEIIWQAASALTATGEYSYILYPGNTDGGQLQGKDTISIPRQWYLQVVHGDADSATYSVGISYLL